MIDFDFTLDQQKEIQRIALQYKREAKKCYSAKAYLSGCILIGAAMEGLLLSTINCFPEIILTAKSAPRAKGKIKHFGEWKLFELLSVAKELGWLPTSLSSQESWEIAKAEIGDYIDIIRKTRNLIHPARYAKELGKKRITKKYLEACFEIVDDASDCLHKVLKSYLAMLRKEMRMRKKEGIIIAKTLTNERLQN